MAEWLVVERLYNAYRDREPARNGRLPRPNFLISDVLRRDGSSPTFRVDIPFQLPSN